MIRKRLLAGLFTLLPLAITVWVVKAVFQALVGLFQGPLLWAAHLLHIPEPTYWQQAVFSALALLLLLLVAGSLVGNFVGRRIMGWMDQVMLNIPMVKGVYGATKQLMGAVQSGQGGSFKEVVLVEWPHPGSHTLGFVARRDCAWAMKGGRHKVAVYIPTAPNPTSGYVVMVDADKLCPVHVSPEQALTWAVSGGVVAPGEPG